MNTTNNTRIESTQNAGQTLDEQVVLTKKDRENLKSVLMSYFDAMNNNDLDQYNLVLRKNYSRNSKDWDESHKSFIGISEIDIHFDETTKEENTIKVPVSYIQTMREDFIPTNINPGKNNVTTCFSMDQDKDNRYYISDFMTLSVKP